MISTSYETKSIQLFSTRNITSLPLITRKSNKQEIIFRNNLSPCVSITDILKTQQNSIKNIINTAIQPTTVDRRLNIDNIIKSNLITIDKLQFLEDNRICLNTDFNLEFSMTIKFSSFSLNYMDKSYSLYQLYISFDMSINMINFTVSSIKLSNINFVGYSMNYRTGQILQLQEQDPIILLLNTTLKQTILNLLQNYLINSLYNKILIDVPKEFVISNTDLLKIENLLTATVNWILQEQNIEQLTKSIHVGYTLINIQNECYEKVFDRCIHPRVSIRIYLDSVNITGLSVKEIKLLGGRWTNSIYTYDVDIKAKMENIVLRIITDTDIDLIGGKFVDKRYSIPIEDEEFIIKGSIDGLYEDITKKTTFTTESLRISDIRFNIEDDIYRSLIRNVMNNLFSTWLDFFVRMFDSISGKLSNLQNSLVETIKDKLSEILPSKLNGIIKNLQKTSIELFINK